MLWGTSVFVFVIVCPHLYLKCPHFSVLGGLAAQKAESGYVHVHVSLGVAHVHSVVSNVEREENSCDDWCLYYSLFVLTWRVEILL